MYDENLLSERMAALGLNYYHLGKRAGVDPKTAKTVVVTGRGQPEKVFLVSKALGFPVTKKGDVYDFSSIVKKRRSA